MSKCTKQSADESFEEFLFLTQLLTLETGVPYIERGDGDRYRVCCDDGGAWDRPTLWGVFNDLASAVKCAQHGPAWRAKK